MDTFSKAVEWLTSREWSIYPFLPPLLAVVLSLRGVPLLDRFFQKRLEEYLKAENAERLSGICWAVARDYRLQFSFLTGVVSLATSAFITLRNATGLAWLLLGFVLVGMVFVAIPLFGESPSRHTTTKLPDKLIWRAFKKDRTYARVYGLAIRLLNVVLIVIILSQLPKAAP